MKLTTPTKEELKIENSKLRDSLRKTIPLARRTMWLAYVWNDYNFDAAHLEARKECTKHGITSFDQANEFLGDVEILLKDK